MNALEYVQKRNLEHRMQTGQIVLRTCPFCGDGKSHFYMDPGEGAFYCHKCGERGNLVTLRKHMGDWESSSQARSGETNPKARVDIREAFPEDNGKRVVLNNERAIQAHQRLQKDHEVLRYVTENRGLGMEAVDHFRIGVEVDRNGGKWLTIPHFIKGKLVNIKSRSLPPMEKTFRRVQGCPSVLFNGDVLEKSREEVFLCEGELDAVTLHGQGIENVIATTAGAGSFLPEWVDQLQGVKKILLVYDSDEAGRKGAREVARRLGYERCFNVVLPDGQDVNDFFQAGNDIFAFQALVNEARPFDVAGILTFQECLQQLQRERETPANTPIGLPTGLPPVDRIMKRGMRPGELIVLSAPPGVGKSSFALQISTYNAYRGIPCLFFSLEMGTGDVTEKIVQAHTRKEDIGSAEIEMTRLNFRGKPLYLGRCVQKPTLDGITETLKAAVRRYGLKLLVFDHLHFLTRSVSNQVQEIGLAVQAFKLLAQEMEIPVILIAQPRKVDLDKPMSAADLKDSSAIHSDADYILILHRARMFGKEKGEEDKGTLDPLTLCRFEKARYGAGGEAYLHFQGDHSRFYPLQTQGKTAETKGV